VEDIIYIYIRYIHLKDAPLVSTHRNCMEKNCGENLNSRRIHENIRVGWVYDH
jgi:hypothetical protein